MDAALRYRADADCEMWLKVMQGDYDEENTAKGEGKEDAARGPNGVVNTTR